MPASFLFQTRVFETSLKNVSNILTVLNIILTQTLCWYSVPSWGEGIDIWKSFWLFKVTSLHSQTLFQISFPSFTCPPSSNGNIRKSHPATDATAGSTLMARWNGIWKRFWLFKAVRPPSFSGVILYFNPIFWNSHVEFFVVADLMQCPIQSRNPRNWHSSDAKYCNAWFHAINPVKTSVRFFTKVTGKPFF